MNKITPGSLVRVDTVFVDIRTKITVRLVICATSSKFILLAHDVVFIVNGCEENFLDTYTPFPRQKQK